MSQNTIGTSTISERSAAHLQFAQFESFLGKADSEKAIASKGTGMSIDVKKSVDFVGHVLRGQASRGMNDDVRETFKSTILKMFGVTDEQALPDEVKSAMKLEDFKKGKPLTARRIRAVTESVSKIFGSKISELEHVARVQGVPMPPETTERIKTAVMASIDDSELFTFVSQNIKGLLIAESDLPMGISGQQTIITQPNFTAKLNKLTAIFGALRTAANGDPDLFKAGEKWLAEIINTNRPLPTPAQLQSVLTSVGQQIELTARHVDKLKNPHVGAEDLNVILREIFQTVDQIMANNSRILSAYDSDDEGNPCRAFLIAAILNKCVGPSALAKAKQVMDSYSTSDLKDLYHHIADDLRCGSGKGRATFKNFNGITPSSARLYMADFVDRDSRRLDTLKTVIDTLSDVSNGKRSTVIPSGVGTKTHFAYRELCREVEKTYKSISLQLVKQEREAFLADAVTGTGVGADMMRHVFARKIGHTPHRPADTVRDHTQDILMRMTCQGATATYRSLCSSPAIQRQTFEHARSGITVYLPDVRGGQEELSTDYDTACDQLAAFLTQGKKRYTQLTAAEKNQVALVMVLITRGTDKTLFEAPARALNPLFNPEAPLEEAALNPAFKMTERKPVEKRTVTLGFDNGSLTAAFSGQREIRELSVLRDNFKEYVDVPVNGSLSVDYTFTIPANVFTQMAAKKPETVVISSANVSCSDFKMGLAVNEATPRQIAATDKRWPKVTVESLSISAEETLKLANELAGIEEKPSPVEEKPTQTGKPKSKHEKIPGFLRKILTKKSDASQSNDSSEVKTIRGKK
ncbi:MAG: hypothetical protein J6U40_10255 [Kiritimatiellae bacterium]|nr:hypothetical protein [Kiritimatiellia bacterium]